MGTIASAPKASGSKALQHGPAVLFICGVLFLAFGWLALHQRLAEMYDDARTEANYHVRLAANNLGQHLAEAKGQWSAHADHLSAFAATQAFPNAQATKLSALLDTRHLGFKSVIYDARGRAVTSVPQTGDDLSTLSPGELQALNKAQYSELRRLDVDVTPTAPLRYARAIQFQDATYYFVITPDLNRLLSTEWLRTIASSYLIFLQLEQGPEVALSATPGVAAPVFTQSLLTRWAATLPQSVHAAASFGPNTLQQTVTVTLYADGVFRKSEARARASTLAALSISILAILALIVGSRTLRRIRGNERTLLALVTVDALTELPNRRSLNDRLDHIFQLAPEARPTVGLLFVDLDNFKPVNDTHGHKMGDLLLRAVAYRLRDAVGPTDTICRLGGDEFAIITNVRDGRSEDMQRVALAVVNCFSEPFVLEGVQIHTAASVGLAYSCNCRTSSELLKNADMAMYDAKNAGKGMYREFSAEMSAKALREEQLAFSFKAALASKQFTLLYQPKVNTFTGKVVGFEALSRWQHPELGPISPAVFVPLAEASGFIHEFGSWVLSRAVAQLVTWNKVGFGWATVAVNVSAIQLLDPFFVGKVKRLIDASGIPPSSLQLELTESVLASNVQHAKSVLGQLRQLGLKIAVDDFGTGYSSLNSLQQFDIDYLKVDKSFVWELGTDAGNKICRSIIGLAHSLGMVVIAEGVETAEQFSALYEMGCDELQGYLLAKPLPPELAPRFSPPVQGLWATIQDTLAAISASDFDLNPGKPAVESGLHLLEMELERVDTDFGTLT